VRNARLWERLLGVERTVVDGVVFDEDDEVIVASVRPRRGATRRCGICERRCPRYDHGQGRRRWRALDLGTVQVWLEADAPRVTCPDHGVVVASVPWARHGAGHTRAFDDMAAWLATHCSKSAVQQLMRVAWRTVGAIARRVVADARALVDPLESLTRIGIDEISYEKGHFSGVGDPARCAHRRVGNEGRRHTLWIPCATCKVRATGGQGAGASDCPDRHARLLDGRRRQLAADSGRRRLPAPPPPRCRARGGHHSFLRR